MKKMNNKYNLDWSELAFGSKKLLRELRATFIMAPRELSTKRLTQIIKHYLPESNLIIGISKESHVLDLEDQPQFTMLGFDEIQTLQQKVNQASPKHKLYTLSYSQRDICFILEKIPFARVVLVNGSWYRAFHLRPEYYALVSANMPFEKISPFADELEAQGYAGRRIKDIAKAMPLPKSGAYTEHQMLELARQAARHSFDFGAFQTGVSLGRKTNEKNEKTYQFLAAAHNTVVPYETFAMHFGAAREKHFSPMNDLNHYDTVHAEVALILFAQQHKLDTKGSTLFINLLPCPTCARMFTQTDIAEFVYSQDHTSGYAVQLLEKAGKKVRRIVPFDGELDGV
jgi:deoxycytidylate deaminase